MLRILAIAVIAAITITSTPAFARGKGGAKTAAKKAHHQKHSRRH